jgi:hypothetical protein
MDAYADIVIHMQARARQIVVDQNTKACQVEWISVTTTGVHVTCEVGRPHGVRQIEDASSEDYVTSRT